MAITIPLIHNTPKKPNDCVTKPNPHSLDPCTNELSQGDIICYTIV